MDNTTTHLLTDREQRVLTLRFGLEDGRSRTLEEVGREFQCMRERVRQIEAKALRKVTQAPEAPTCCHDCINIQAIITAEIKSKIANTQ